MKRLSRRKRLAAVVGVSAVVLLLAQGAAADQSYSDPAGDATNGAPDITAIQVTNDAAGWITFHVSVSGLPQAETLILLPINADLNMATGSSGNDFALALDGQSTASLGLRWDGAALVTWSPSMGLQPSFAGGVWTVKINKADLFGTNRFAFWVASAKSSGDQIIGSDVAPDGAAVYTYDVTQPPPPTPPPTPTPTPKPKPTPPAARPISAARLAGEFDMKLRLTAKKSMNADARDSGTWQFAPRCASGPCATRVHAHAGSIIDEHVWNVRLNRTGARYAGSGRSVIAECMLEDVVGTTTVKLTVKRAAWIDGVWRATAVSGTYHRLAPRVESGVFFCPAGSATYSFTGKLSR
jgi:hypothetical protein